MKHFILLLIASLGICDNACAQRAPLPTNLPDSVKEELDITYGKAPGQELKLDIFRPKNDAVLPACLLVHGGRRVAKRRLGRERVVRMWTNQSDCCDTISRHGQVARSDRKGSRIARACKTARPDI